MSGSQKDPAAQYRYRRGELSALHIREGDVTIKFSSRRPEDVEKARHLITNLLQRGYAILTKDKSGKYRRVKAFKPSTTTYVISEVAGDVEVPATEARATAIPPTVGG